MLARCIGSGALLLFLAVAGDATVIQAAPKTRPKTLVTRLADGNFAPGLALAWVTNDQSVALRLAAGNDGAQIAKQLQMLLPGTSVSFAGGQLIIRGVQPERLLEQLATLPIDREMAQLEVAVQQDVIPKGPPEPGGSIRASEKVDASQWNKAAKPSMRAIGSDEGTEAQLTPEMLYQQVRTAVVFIEAQRGEEPQIGSGVILHQDGFVATAAHVVENAATIAVEFVDGMRTRARIASLSRTEDLALLKVDAMPEWVHTVPLADSDKLAVGQTIYCLGAPLGHKHTLTSGIISAIRKDYGSQLSLHPHNVIQTDASINQGNSGGALFNLRGEVVGIASFLASKTGGSVGLNFAVPSNTVRQRLFNESIPYMGLILRRIPTPLATMLQWRYRDALLIEQVEPGSIAARAGLRGGYITADFAGVPILMGGDLIIKVNEFDVDQAAAIQALLHGLKNGDRVNYTVLRAGEPAKFSVTIESVIPIPSLPPR
jgi:serine protease Do